VAGAAADTPAAPTGAGRKGGGGRGGSALLEKMKPQLPSSVFTILNVSLLSRRKCFRDLEGSKSRSAIHSGFAIWYGRAIIPGASTIALRRTRMTRSCSLEPGAGIAVGAAA